MMLLTDYLTADEVCFENLDCRVPIWHIKYASAASFLSFVDLIVGQWSIIEGAKYI